MKNITDFYDQPVQIRLTDGTPVNSSDFEIIKIWTNDKLRVSIKNVSPNPFKIKEEIPLDDLFDLELGDLKIITDEVIKAMEAFLPKQPEGGTPKKPTTPRKKAKKKSLK